MHSTGKSFCFLQLKQTCGQLIDNDACKRLFNLSASVGRSENSKEQNTLPSKLIELKKRQIDAKLAEDKAFAAEEALRDTKAQIKSVKRGSRHTITVEEQKQNQEKLKQLERLQKRQRMEIFDIEDEIADKRDELIAVLEERMKQGTKETELFTIRWHVI